MKNKEAQMSGDTMGGMPMGGPMPMGGEETIIKGPIESVGAILHDFDIENYIARNPEKDESEIAAEIWEAYGGDWDGSVPRDKKGRRTEEDNQRTIEEVKQERSENEDKKWERLKDGLDIGEITSLEELVGLVKSLIYGTIQKYKNKPEEGAGGGMGGLPFASKDNRMQKEAIKASIVSEYKLWKEKLKAKFKK